MSPTKSSLLKEIERFGKIKPSDWNPGTGLEIKPLLRKLYRYVKTGELPETIDTVEEMEEMLT